MQWKYKTFKIEEEDLQFSGREANDLEKDLNDLGRQGWELVTSMGISGLSGSTNEVMFILKKQV